MTGCNGFIGSHVVDQLLMLGYLVRGTVRELKPWLNEFFDQKYGKVKHPRVEGHPRVGCPSAQWPHLQTLE